MEKTFKVSACINQNVRPMNAQQNACEMFHCCPLQPHPSPQPFLTLSAHLMPDTGRRSNTNSQHKTGQSKALPMAPSSHHIPQPQHRGHGRRMPAPRPTNDLLWVALRRDNNQQQGLSGQHRACDHSRHRVAPLCFGDSPVLCSVGRVVKVTTKE